MENCHVYHRTIGDFGTKDYDFYEDHFEEKTYIPDAILSGNLKAKSRPKNSNALQDTEPNAE